MCDWGSNRKRKSAMRFTVGAAVMLVVGAVSTAGAAQKPASNALVDAVAACQSQQDDQARLRCYDQAAAALTQATQSGTIVVVDREDVRKTRRSLFGFSLPKLPFFSGDDSAKDQQDEITATVASASALGYGKYRVRIEDGAIWETTEGWPTLREPRLITTVSPRRGSLGSYLMKIDGQRGLKAKRVG